MGIEVGIGAAVASAVGLTAGTTAFAVTAITVNIAIAAALSTVASAIAAKTANDGPSSATRTGNIRNALAPHEVVYGSVRKGGPVFYVNGSGQANTRLHLCIALASHACEEVTNLYLNGELIGLDLIAPAASIPIPPFGEISIIGNPPYRDPTLDSSYSMYVPVLGRKEHAWAAFNWRLGSPTQTAIPGMVMECTNWDSSHQAKGRTYVYARLLFDDQGIIWPSFIPAITARIKGKNDILDTRTSARGWTDNPALIAADILETYLGVPRSRIDATALNEAANICDEAVAKKGGGTEKRYRCGGYFSLEGEPEDWLKPVALAMAGAVVEHQGIYYIRAGKWRTPEITIGDADIMGKISVKTAGTDRDRANAARGMFASSESYDQPTDFPQVVDAAAVAADGGVQQAMEVDLSFCPSHRQAQRVAKILLRSSRFGRTVEIATNLLKGLDVRPWDNVTLALTTLGLNGTFRVINHHMTLDGDPPALRPVLTLQEVGTSIYDWDAATEEQDLVLNSSLIPGSALEPQLLDYQVTTYSSGTTFKPAKLTIGWVDPPDITFAAIEVEAIIHFQSRVGVGAWVDQVLECKGEAAPGDELLNLDMIDPDVSGTWSFQLVQVERVRVRTRVSDENWSEWTTKDGDLSAPIAGTKTLTSYATKGYHAPATVKASWSAPSTGTVSKYELEITLSYNWRIGGSGAYTAAQYTQKVTTTAKSLNVLLWDKSKSNASYQFTGQTIDVCHVRALLTDGSVSSWTDI